MASLLATRVGQGLAVGALLTAVMGLRAATRRQRPAPRTVSYVELRRYMGTWFEIARFPMWQERNCVASQAHYALCPDGTVEVVNTCLKGGFDGKHKSAHAKAWVAEPASNAKLKLRFGMFTGDYWIFELGAFYEYAVVGSPDRKYVWILSRTPHMDDDVYERLVRRLHTDGFDVRKLRRTPQPAAQLEDAWGLARQEQRRPDVAPRE